MLNWTNRFNIFCLLDSNHYGPLQQEFDCKLAAGSAVSISLERSKGLDDLQAFYEKNKSELFGHFGYELFCKTPVNSREINHEVIFDDVFFFKPEFIITLHNDKVIVESESKDPATIFNEIMDQPAVIARPEKVPAEISKTISAATYMDIMHRLKEHIHRGDCYEINFCQSFYAEDVSIDPVYFYQQLSAVSPNPFAAFYRVNDKYCFCASPERFLKKSGDTLISQPIQGTSKRNLQDQLQDMINRDYLLNSEKEKCENVMIVDLVRNDLSKVCKEGSVEVKELFGVYSFPQVHQMISTIEGKVAPDVKWTDIIKACFPMGSMTGAPKARVMELIEKYEAMPRGIFSGSIGYINATGDFDFNVVIRSVMYDAAKKLLSFKAGSGITFNSDPEQEYEECLLKAEAIIRVLTGN